MLYRTFVAGGSTMVVPARFVFLCVLCAFRGESFSGFNTEDTEKGHRGPRRIKKTDKNSCHAYALACVVGSRVIHGKGRVLGGSRLMADAIVIIDDLNARQGALEAVDQLCNGRGLRLQPDGISNAPDNPRRVIAFLSHVQTDLAER